MQYSFRTTKEDKEIDKILSQKASKERSLFIREALYNHIKQTNCIQKLDKIEKQTEEIFNLLKDTNLTINTKDTESSESEEIKIKAEDIMKMSLKQSFIK